MKKEIYFPILGIATGELMMFYGQMHLGLGMHIVNLEAITLALIFTGLPSEIKKALQSLILLLLMRIISLAMPQFFTMTLLWYLLVYGVMILPVYLIIKHQHISLKEIGVTFSRFHIYLPVALLIGAAAAMLESRVLNLAPLIEDTRLSNLVLVAVITFIFAGMVEELIFRSILQTRLEQALGLNQGLLLSSSIFGIMHASSGIVNEIIFAGVFGIAVGYIFQRTRSLPFILMIHGTANAILIGILQ